MRRIPGWAMAALVMAVVVGLAVAGAGAGWAMTAGAAVLLAGMALRGRDAPDDPPGDTAARKSAGGNDNDGTGGDGGDGGGSGE